MYNMYLSEIVWPEVKKKKKKGSTQMHHDKINTQYYTTKKLHCSCQNSQTHD